MNGITLYEVTWRNAKPARRFTPDQTVVSEEYSALVIRAPKKLLDQVDICDSLNEQLSLAGWDRSFAEAFYNIPPDSEDLLFMPSGTCDSSRVLPLIKGFFREELSLIARKTAKPLTQQHLDRLSLLAYNHPRMRVRSATTYIPPQGLLKTLELAREAIKYKPGGQAFEEAQTSFYYHAKQFEAMNPAPKKKSRSRTRSACAGRPRSNCTSDLCKWAGPGPKSNREYCRIAKNRKRSRS